MSDAIGNLQYRPEWMDTGACADADPDLFFPRRGEDSRPGKAICRECQHRLTCLEFALANGEKFGTWGGMSERERRRLRRTRRLAAVAA